MKKKPQQQEELEVQTATENLAESSGGIVPEDTRALSTPQHGPKRGLEELSQQEDFEIPRALLLQSNSPMVVDDQSGKYRAGMVVNSLTGEFLPDEFIPILKFAEWIRWNPRDPHSPIFDSNFGPGKMIWKSRNPEDPLVIEQGKFGPKGERPLATKYLNFFSYFPGIDMPVIISFCNTSFPAGRKLNTLCFGAKESAIYARKYKLGKKVDQNDKGKFWILQTELAGHTSEEDYKIADQWYHQFRPIIGRVVVHEEEESLETPAAPATDEERPF